MKTKAVVLMLAPLLAAGFLLPQTSLTSSEPYRVDIAPNSLAQEDHGDKSASSVSQIEDATGLHYQHDAGVEGDAPGACAEVDDRRILEPDADDPMQAMLVEIDDEADVFSVPIGTQYVGERLHYDLIPSIGAGLYTLDFDIVDATCGSSVFDPESDLYHPERDAPEQPYDAKLGYQTVDFDPDQKHGCKSDEWKFQIKHSGGVTPTSLYVQWSNGDYTHVDSDDTDPSQVAKYTTSHDVEHTITRIATQMPVAWDGKMSILTGPCDTTAWDPDEPQKGEFGGNFTVVQEGEYVLIVTMEEGVVDAVTMPETEKRQTCHDFGACALAFGEISYESDLSRLAYT